MKRLKIDTKRVLEELNKRKRIEERSQSWLARRLGLSRQAIWFAMRAEKGGRNFKSVEQIADVLDEMDPLDLLMSQ